MQLSERPPVEHKKSPDKRPGFFSTELAAAEYLLAAERKVLEELRSGFPFPARTGEIEAQEQQVAEAEQYVRRLQENPGEGQQPPKAVARV